MDARALTVNPKETILQSLPSGEIHWLKACVFDSHSNLIVFCRQGSTQSVEIETAPLNHADKV